MFLRILFTNPNQIKPDEILSSITSLIDLLLLFYKMLKIKCECFQK